MSATTTEEAARIRAALKALGYTSRDVSVRAEYFSLGSEINVTVKRASVPIAAVRKVAAPSERITHDEFTGEILGGGNRYLTVAYSPEALAELVAPVLARLRLVEERPGAWVELGRGWGAKSPCADDHGEWTAYVPGRVNVRMWGMQHAAEHIALMMQE